MSRNHGTADDSAHKAELSLFLRCLQLYKQIYMLDVPQQNKLQDPYRTLHAYAMCVYCIVMPNALRGSLSQDIGCQSHAESKDNIS